MNATLEQITEEPQTRKYAVLMASKPEYYKRLMSILKSAGYYCNFEKIPSEEILTQDGRYDPSLWLSDGGNIYEGLMAIVNVVEDIRSHNNSANSG